MIIDFANLGLAYQEHKKDIDKAMSNVIDNSSFIMGPIVSELEERLSNFVGVRHSITCEQMLYCWQ